MSDQLFPDAVAVDPVAIRPPGKKRGSGIAAFVLGLLALLGDVAVAILIFAAFTGIANQDDSAIGFAFAVLLASIVGFWAGILLAVLSIIFGIIALVRKRGRVFAVVGMLLGLVTLAVNIIVGVVLVFNFDQFSTLTTQLS
jgi:hypothetical protein